MGQHSAIFGMLCLRGTLHLWYILGDRQHTGHHNNLGYIDRQQHPLSFGRQHYFHTEKDYKDQQVQESLEVLKREKILIYFVLIGYRQLTGGNS